MNIENAKLMAELAQERLGLLERLAEIEKEWGSLMSGNQPVAHTTEKRRGPGRPPGSLNKPKDEIVVEGDKSKPKYLPDLLVHIASEHKKPLKLADFLNLVNAAGYESKATDKSNMVYQSLLKLIKKGVIAKDQDTREYSYVGEKVA